MMPATLAEKITAAAGHIMGERREVTVLFLDTKDYTASTYSLDNEDTYLIIDEAMRLLVEVVFEYEGTVDKFTGDGLMALFGAPVAHENDPERAVRAALEMHSVLQPLRRQIRREHGFDLQVRIGINTGLVVAGQVGNNLHMEYTVIGDTVNLASRLEKLAEPGTILASFETYQRTRPLFRFRTWPSLRIKGVPEPIPAYQPLALRRVPGRLRGLPGLRIPMIGRTHDLNRLKGALGEVQQKQGNQIVLITGEAGLGKSRLVAEFQESLSQAGVNVYEGSCLAYARSRPFWVIAELVRDIIHLPETDPTSVKRQTLQTYLQHLNLSISEVAPYLINLLGLVQENTDVEAHLRLLDATMMQRQTHAALRQILMAEARLAPTVLILDDLHWIDPASRDFLEYLITSIDNVPLLLILVSRELERHTVIEPLLTAAFKSADRFIDIQLKSLSQAEGQLLVDQLIKQTSKRAQSLKQRIVARGEGNPFYVEEIIRMLVDQGGLVRKEGGWEITPEADRHLEEVPGTLKGLILARFDSKPEGLRRLLQKAAVIGRSFPVSLLQGLEGSNPEEIGAYLRDLEAQQFLVSQDFGNEQGYAFRHALIQEAVYSTLLRRHRQRIHEQVAEAIEQGASWLPEERSEVLAFHFSESAHPTHAVPYLLTAAENAALRSAHETAIQHYRSAIALLPETASRQSEDFYRARIGLARTLKFVGEISEASQVLNETLNDLLQWSLTVEPGTLLPSLVDGLRELGDVRAREGALDEAITHLEAALNTLEEKGGEEQAGLWRSLIERMAFVRFRQGRLAEALELASSATIGVSPEQTDDPITLASLYNSLGGILWQQGNPTDAIAYVERSLKLYKKIGYSWGVANAYSNLGVLYYRQGDWSKAAENWEQAYSLRQEIGDIQNQALNLANLGHLRMTMGKHQAAKQNLQTSLEIRKQLADTWGIAHVQVTLAQLAIIKEEYEQAEEHAQSALSLANTIGSTEIEVQARLILALTEAEGGRLPLGLESAEKALRMARDGDLVDLETDCLRITGMLQSRIGSYSSAESQLRASIDLCKQHNDPYREGLALLELGRMYQELAHPENPGQDEWRKKATASLVEASAKFADLGADYDLLLVKRLLAWMEREVAVKPGPLAVSDGAIDAAHRPGERLATAGERHKATIVWLSLIPPPDADDELVFETVSLVTPPLITIAQEYSGEAFSRRDGLTVVFGAPTAYEDDPERAVQTAWYMLQYLRKAAGRMEVPLTTQLAVSQGEVIAGKMGSPTQSELVVTGEPVRRAQELAETLPGDSIWLDESVQSAVERLFVFEPAGEEITAELSHLKIAEVAGVRDEPAPARGLPGLQARLIGRDAPYEVMLDLSQNLHHGRGGMILIEGEAGIGKSRLMWEFAAALASNGISVWAGHCSPQRSNHAFSLFSNVLAQVFNLQLTDSPEAIYNKIETTISNWPEEARATRPYLEMLAGARPTGLEGDRLESLEPDQLRQQTFVATRTLLKNMAAEKSLVLLLDDLHWIDPMSAELLLFLSNMITSIPILFVATQRWEESERANERLVKAFSLHQEQTIRLFLEPLSLMDSEVLLSELLSRAKLPTRLRTTILKRSEGNPYYIEEFVRMLIEQDYLRYHADGWALNTNMDIGRMPIPSSLEALIRSRVDALPWDLKQLLQLAAVIGRPFEASLMESVSGMAHVKSILGRLVARGMLREATEANRWYFSHSMFEIVVYKTLLRSQRKNLHLKVAETLEERWAGAEAEHAEELAHHFSQAEDEIRALRYLSLAGERAAARHANDEALAHFKQAAELLARQPDAADSLRWRIITGLGDVYRFMGDYSESTATLKTGLSMVEIGDLSDDMRAGLYRRLGETTQKQADFETSQRYFDKALEILQEPQERGSLIEAARTLARSAWTHLQQGKFEEAEAASRASQQYARKTGSLSELAAIENVLGGVSHFQGKWKSALIHTRQAMNLWEEMGYTWGVATALSNLGILAVSTGDWADARSFFRQSLALRQEMGDVEGIAIIHNNLGSLALDQGDLKLAENHFSESLSTATVFSMAFHIVSARIGLAQIYLLEERFDAAQETLAVCLNQAEAIGAKDRVAELYRIQAELLLAQGAPEEALDYAKRSGELAAGIGNRILEATAWRLASATELRLGNLRAAREALAKAWMALTESTNELETGRVTIQAGRLSLYEGQSAEARKQFETASEIFRRLGAKLDLKRVEQELMPETA